MKVGDIGIITQSGRPDIPAGAEYPVLEVHTPPLPWSIFGGACIATGCLGAQYLIEKRPCERVYGCDVCLRKKRPPGDKEPTGEWELCPWRPGKKETCDEQG